MSSGFGKVSVDASGEADGEAPSGFGKLGSGSGSGFGKVSAAKGGFGRGRGKGGRGSGGSSSGFSTLGGEKSSGDSLIFGSGRCAMCVTSLFGIITDIKCLQRGRYVPLRTGCWSYLPAGPSYGPHYPGEPLQPCHLVTMQPLNLTSMRRSSQGSGSSTPRVTPDPAAKRRSPEPGSSLTCHGMSQFSRNVLTQAQP